MRSYGSSFAVGRASRTASPHSKHRSSVARHSAQYTGQHSGEHTSRIPCWGRRSHRGHLSKAALTKQIEGRRDGGVFIGPGGEAQTGRKEMAAFGAQGDGFLLVATRHFPHSESDVSLCGMPAAA